VTELISKNSIFAKFIKERNCNPESHGLVFQAFLVTPVQRIPRYKLLLQDLLKNTPQNHQDYEDLKNAVKLISDGIQTLNQLQTL
jgi:FYVE, RhoGEF and PH domain containing 3